MSTKLGTEEDYIMTSPLSFFKNYALVELLLISKNKKALINDHSHLSELQFQEALSKYSDVIQYIKENIGY